MVCAAMFPVEEGDTYIDDGLHYEMSVIRKVIGSESMEKHKLDGRWYWLGNIPEGVEIQSFSFDRDPSLGSILDGR